jgi:hypothetical protein
VHLDRDQIDIDGQAILFETGLFAKLPADIPEKMALAILDVAGAPAQTARLVHARRHGGGDRRRRQVGHAVCVRSEASAPARPAA